jgi:class 3 adenylate cyclase
VATIAPPAVPETRYARSGNLSVAYQLTGRGPHEVVLAGSPAAHIEVIWESPVMARFWERHGRFARMAVFDRRGTGASDPLDGPLTLEAQCEDITAVIDAAGFERPALSSTGDAARAFAIYAATHPERVSALILTNASAVGAAVLRPEIVAPLRRAVESSWGKGELARIFTPSMAEDPSWTRFFGKLERYAASPAMASKLIEMNLRADIREILPTIRVPTLVIHRRDSKVVPPELGRHVADAIPGAKFVEIPGEDSLPSTQYSDEWFEEVEEFLTGVRPAPEPERVLTTLLFTDIADSTEVASRLGDRRWRHLLEQHNRVVRRELDRFRGNEIKSLGDGFLATFDGPARALRAAQAIGDHVSQLGIRIRAGVHTGEVETLGGDVGGMAVHIGARVGALAAPGELLVSGTVRDLVIGSELEFEERGVHALKGVPGEWRVFALR